MSKLLEQAEALQNLLISQATGGREDNSDFAAMRSVLLHYAPAQSAIPGFLRTCRSLDQFWPLMKSMFGTYAERRAYIWAEFRPLLELLERGSAAPADHVVSQSLERVDAAHVRAAWSKALERRSTDPEGAITSARTLIESVCKHILDEAKPGYDDGADLPKLYKWTAEALNLAPSQHTETVFKQILGGCTSVVEGLGSLRNRLSDAHGKGKAGAKPAPRHAELAVNLSGALAVYLLATWDAREDQKASPGSED